MQQQFSVADILTVVTGRLYSNMENLYKLLDFLTQENLMTHHLPIAAQFVKEQLISQLPPSLQDLCIQWEHTEDWQDKLEQANDLFGQIPLIPIDKKGFKEYMVENSLLVNSVLK